MLKELRFVELKDLEVGVGGLLEEKGRSRLPSIGFLFIFRGSIEI